MKKETPDIRADTYLWAIRMFKTRTQSSAAIKGGKVKLKGINVKSSHYVKVGETYTLMLGKHQKIIEVTALLDRRGSFELAQKHYIDHSPPIEKTEKADKAFFTMNVKHEKGTGRPTKKNRRNLNKEGGWF